MTGKHYTLHEAAAAIGQSYSRCWHAYAYKRLPSPLRVGRTFVLTDDDLTVLKQHLTKQGEGKATPHDPDAHDRGVPGVRGSRTP